MKILDLPDQRSGTSRRWSPESSPALIPSPEILALSRRSVRSFELAENERCVVSMRRGVAWVTLEGDSHDFILDDPRPTEFNGPGRLVIEAIEEAIVELAILKRPGPDPS